MLGFGLVGTGAMGRVYADRLAEMDSAEATAVASPNTAEAFVEERVPSATAYSDVEALCADDAVDAVAVLSPTHTHRDVVETAAENGLDVICEKPIERTLADAEAIADTVSATDITFMTAHVVRFFPEYATARERVEAGDVGDPGVARTRRAFGFGGERDGWGVDQEKSGGVTLDLAIHDLDYLRWVLGDVERVFTRTTAWGENDGSEVSLTLLRFESGAVGHVESWWVGVPSVPFTTAFEFAGDEGHIEYDVEDVRPVAFYGEDGVHVPRDPAGHDPPLERDGYRRQLEHFVDCVETGTEPAITAADGVESLRVGLAALESAERGEPVAPAEVGR